MGLKPVPVGQLNNYIGRVLKTDPILSNISVVGEISNLKYHSSGHVYFSLKDDSSRVNCFLSWGNLQNISCPLEEGMEVVAAGFISVYERGGYYSLNVRDIEVNGRGQLAAAFEKLKAKLGEEGLFREEHKKELPFFPLKIALWRSYGPLMRRPLPAAYMNLKYLSYPRWDMKRILPFRISLLTEERQHLLLQRRWRFRIRESSRQSLTESPWR